MTIRTLVLATALFAGSATGCASDDDDPEPASCTTEMFGKYKQAGFEAVNSKILENIVAVSSLNPSPIGDSFKGLAQADVDRIEANLLDLLIFVYGGPNNYEGQSMEDAHVGLNITSEQYDAFVGMVIVPALQDVGVEAADITDCFAPPVVDPAFKASMVGK
jgi:Bacterial-like globin